MVPKSWCSWVLTSQYVCFATEANWLLWDCLQCNLVQYLTKLPLFATQCFFHRRQTVGSLCSVQDDWENGHYWEKKLMALKVGAHVQYIYPSSMSSWRQQYMSNILCLQPNPIIISSFTMCTYIYNSIKGCISPLLQALFKSVSISG